MLAYVLYFYVPNPNIIFLSRCLAGIAYGADGAVVGQVSRLDEIFLRFLMQTLIIIMNSEIKSLNKVSHSNRVVLPRERTGKIALITCFHELGFFLGELDYLQY